MGQKYDYWTQISFLSSLEWCRREGEKASEPTTRSCARESMCVCVYPLLTLGASRKYLSNYNASIQNRHGSSTEFNIDNTLVHSSRFARRLLNFSQSNKTTIGERLSPLTMPYHTYLVGNTYLLITFSLWRVIHDYFFSSLDWFTYIRLALNGTNRQSIQ